ncbi:hypothetical protein KCU62_g5587, partial [Aureobasidium sp. EXF-3399]
MEDMRTKLDSLLTPAQKAAYDDQVQHMRDIDATTTSILDASMLVAVIAGGLELSVRPLTAVLGTGALAAGSQLFTRGVRMLLEGETEGLRFMTAAFRTFRVLSTAGEASEAAARVARYVRTASSVVVVLGVVLDGILLVYQAIEGAKQKTAFEDGIQDLTAHRFQTKNIEQQIFATEAYTASVSAFMVTYQVLKSAGESDEKIKLVTDQLMVTVAENLHTDLDKITNDSVWSACLDIDQKSNYDGPHSWDPNQQTVLDWIAAQPPVVPADSHDIASNVERRKRM